MSLEPGGLIAWIIVGLVAGWLAGRITQDRGFGCIGNVLLGLAGAFIGSILLDIFIDGRAALLGTLAVATFGAVILLAIANLARR